MTKILRVGSAAVAAAGVILATGAFALTPGSPARAGRSTPAQPIASTGNVLPGQPMIPATLPGRPATSTASGTSAATRSVNWAGYATTRGGKSFSSIAATFLVP